MILFSQIIDKIASGSFYKYFKLWEIHDYIFMNVFKICLKFYTVNEE